MTSREESGPGSLGFFTGVSVDDKKYESLLEDLRAHDLLGPVDDLGYDAYGTGGLSGRPSSSLLLHDNLSAIFSGSVPNDKKSPTYEQRAAPAAPTRAPPPGFASAPVGSAPTQADLEWARSQHEFALLREDFSRKAVPPADASAKQPSYLYSEEDEDDDVLLENLTIQDLGLDDDDDKQRVTRQAVVLPPIPSSLPPPPSLPPGLQHPSQPPAPSSPPPQGVAAPHGTAPPPQGPAPYPPSHPYPPPPGSYPPPPPMPGHYGVPPPHHHPHGPVYQHPPMHYPPPPPQQLYHGPSPHAIMNEKVFKVMNPRDVQFVVQQQLKQIRSSDPFSDDYYFHNYHVKRERSSAQPTGAPTALPLPSWKLEHVKAFDPRDVSRASKSREWETENHVLGRTAKSSLYRPREMLHLSQDNTATSTGEVALTRESTPETSVFLNDSWSKRQRIDEGLVHLLALQDARHILDARHINVAHFHQMDPAQMDPALIELRNKTATLLLDLAKVLGVTNQQQPADGFDRAALDGILAVSKGKKLVCRALPLLHPSARFVLFPHLMHYVLVQSLAVTNPDETTVADIDRLAQTLVVALLYQHPTPPADILAQSIQVGVAPQTLQSLSLVLHNRARAEVLQALLQKGAVVCETASEDVKATWLKYQDIFVALASRLKETAQP